MAQTCIAVVVVAVGKLRNCASRCEDSDSDPLVCDNAHEQIPDPPRILVPMTFEMQVRTYLGREADESIHSLTEHSLSLPTQRRRRCRVSITAPIRTRFLVMLRPFCGVVIATLRQRCMPVRVCLPSFDRKGRYIACKQSHLFRYASGMICTLSHPIR